MVTLVLLNGATFGCKCKGDSIFCTGISNAIDGQSSGND